MQIANYHAQGHIQANELSIKCHCLYVYEQQQFQFHILLIRQSKWDQVKKHLNDQILQKDEVKIYENLDVNLNPTTTKAITIYNLPEIKLQVP